MSKSPEKPTPRWTVRKARAEAAKAVREHDKRLADLLHSERELQAEASAQRHEAERVKILRAEQLELLTLSDDGLAAYLSDVWPDDAAAVALDETFDRPALVMIRDVIDEMADQLSHHHGGSCEVVGCPRCKAIERGLGLLRDIDAVVNKSRT